MSNKLKSEVLRQWQNKHKEEILAVKKLGESIGYANIMSIASALWGIETEDDENFTGPFIPTKLMLMEQEAADDAFLELKRRMKQIKKILK